jgi:hypothetical protein
MLDYRRRGAKEVMHVGLQEKRSKGGHAVARGTVTRDAQ